VIRQAVDDARIIHGIDVHPNYATRTETGQILKAIAVAVESGIGPFRLIGRQVDGGVRSVAGVNLATRLVGGDTTCARPGRPHTRMPISAV
jgi:hypothetical protein